MLCACSLLLCSCALTGRLMGPGSAAPSPTSTDEQTAAPAPPEVGQPLAVVEHQASAPDYGELPRVFTLSDELRDWIDEGPEAEPSLASAIPDAELREGEEVAVAALYDRCDLAHRVLAGEPGTVRIALYDPTPGTQLVCETQLPVLVVQAVPLEQIGASAPDDVEVVVER